MDTAQRAPEPVADACCPSVTQEILSTEDAHSGSPSSSRLWRSRLGCACVSIIAAQENREACVCDLTEPVGLGQPTVSHHLKILVDAGILRREKRGVWAYYAIIPGALERAAAVLSPAS